MGLVGFGISALASVVSLQVESLLSTHRQMLLPRKTATCRRSDTRAQLTGAS